MTMLADTVIKGVSQTLHPDKQPFLQQENRFVFVFRLRVRGLLSQVAFVWGRGLGVRGHKLCKAQSVQKKVQMC